MSNIAEGYERGSRAESHQFLTIAKASCAEVRSQLSLAYDLDYLDTNAFEQLGKDAEEISRIIGGLRTKIGSQRKQNLQTSGTA